MAKPRQEDFLSLVHFLTSFLIILGYYWGGWGFRGILILGVLLRFSIGVAAYFYGGVLSMAATMPRYGANQEARCRAIFKAMRMAGCRPPAM
eukprot:5749801-Amphidinium_carterae.1